VRGAPGRSLFEEMDTDGSGSIDADELAAGLKARGYTVSKAEIEQLIDRMDINQDGTLEFDEFSSALVDWKKVPHRMLGVLHSMLCDLSFACYS
jgi:calcium-dependent protein kinase